MGIKENFSTSSFLKGKFLYIQVYYCSLLCLTSAHHHRQQKKIMKSLANVIIIHILHASGRIWDIPLQSFQVTKAVFVRNNSLILSKLEPVASKHETPTLTFIHNFPLPHPEHQLEFMERGPIGIDGTRASVIVGNLRTAKVDGNNQSFDFRVMGTT